MKCLTRCSLLLCCFLLFFTLCSVPASAENLEVPDYYIDISQEFFATTDYASGALRIYPKSGEAPQTGLTSKDDFISPSDIDYYSTTYWRIHSVDGTPLVYKGGPFTFSLFDAYYSHYFNGAGGFYRYINDASTLRALVLYADGSGDYIYDIDVTNDGPICNLGFEFTPTKDVMSVEFYIVDSFQPSNKTFALNGWMGMLQPSTWQISINQQSEESGLLGGIWDTLTSGFSALGDKLSSVVDAVVNLPAKIWEFIENGLKSLFVPDEEYMTAYKQKLEDLLADRLGAVYQVVQITFGAWEDIETADEINTINIPVVTIPLLDNQSFSFGGYDVKIVPDGFDILVTALKSIVGIVCTIMFINGLRKRYDEIMGVEQ